MKPYKVFYTFLIWFFFNMFGSVCWANTRFIAMTGYGESATTVENRTGFERPGLMSFSAEYIYNERAAWGVEHFRTYEYVDKNFSTAVAFTGFYYRWYFLTPVSQVLKSGSDYKGDYVEQINFSPYVLLSTGVGQSSLRDKTGGAPTKGSVGLYVSGRLGADYPVVSNMGLMADVLVGQTLMGTGQIQVNGFGLGLYYNF